MTDGYIACGPGPVSSEDQSHILRFAQFLKVTGDKAQVDREGCCVRITAETAAYCFDGKDVMPTEVDDTHPATHTLRRLDGHSSAVLQTR